MASAIALKSGPSRTVDCVFGYSLALGICSPGDGIGGGNRLLDELQTRMGLAVMVSIR